MAGDAPDAPSLASGAQKNVPIAQLCPELADQATRSVEGEITVVWPYSLVTKSIAFKLVETDFRLRRDKGQVRIDFHGAAGKAVSDAVLEGGDTVRLGLDGAAWERASPETVARPGTLEWQLKFSNRLRLHVCRAESPEEVTIDVDVPETEIAPELEIPRSITPVNGPSTPDAAPSKDINMDQSPIASLPAKRLASTTFEADEYASPAFIKRARVSYGSLFEGGLDSIMGGQKGSSRRKRPRFSMNSNWKYSSRTPSPEPEPTSQLEEDEDEDEGNTPTKLPDSSSTARTGPEEVAMDKEKRDATRSPTPARQASQPRTPPTTNNTQVPSFFSGPEELPSGTPNTELTQNPFLSGYIGLDNGGPVSGTTASQQRDLHLELPQASPVVSALHGTFPESRPAQVMESSSAMSLPDVLPNAPQHMPLESPGDELRFLDGDYNVDMSNPVHGDHVHGFHTAGDTIFPQAPDTSAHETHHPTGPFASQPLDQLPWTDFIQDSSSAYPPPPTHHNNSQNPVEIIDSSSPPRQPSEPAEEPPELEAQASPASEEDDQEPAIDDDGEVDSDEALEEDRADFEVDDNESEEGADLLGEDYDLRNYDRTKDDDEVEAESTPEPSSSDPDEQVADLGPPSDAEEANESDVDQEGASAEEDDRASSSSQSADAEAQGFDFDDIDDGMDEVDDDGMGAEEDEEGYSEDEYEYDEEGGDEEVAVPRAAASQEPVVIDLLSDSEDEDEPPAPKPASPALPTPTRIKTRDDAANHNKLSDEKTDEDSGSPEPKADHDEVSHKSDEGADEEDDGDNERETNAPDNSVVGQLLSAAKEVDDGRDDEMDVDHEDADNSLVSMDDAGASEEVEVRRRGSEAAHSVEEPGLDDEKIADEAEGTAVDASLVDADELEAKVVSQEEELISDVLMDDSAGDLAPASDDTQERVEEVATEAGAVVGTVLDGAHDDLSPEVEMAIEVEGEVDGSQSKATATVTSLGIDAQTVNRSEVTESERDLVEPVMQEAVEQLSKARSESGELAQLPSQHAEPPEIPETASPKGQTQSVELPVPADQTHSATTDLASEELPQKSRAQDATTELLDSPELATSIAPQQQSVEEKADSEEEHEDEHEAHLDLSSSIQPQTQLGSPIKLGRSTPERDTTFQDQIATSKETTENSGIKVASHEAQQLLPSAHSPPQQEPRNATASDDDSKPTAEKPPTLKDMSQEVDGGAQVSPREMSFDDDITAEQQIMAESQEYQQALSQLDDMQDKDSESQPVASSDRAHKSAKRKRDPDASITVQSLRSWDHRRSTSSDAGVNDHLQDPSVALAKAPPSSATKTTREDSRPRTATNEQPQDPSIALARASAPSTAATSREDAKSRLTVHVTRSMVDHADPSLDLARAPTTPRRSSRKHATPDRSLDTPALSQSFRDKTPETTTNDDVLNTPSVVDSTVEDEQVSTLKKWLTKDLRTNLPECLHLKAIRNHQKKVMDAIGVVTRDPLEPYRPKGGPRDYMLELIITDQAASPNNVVVAQFFRPHKSSLPLAQVGDVVILRQFQTLSLNKRGVGLRSTDESAWAVIEKRDQEMLPQIKGPPVEVSEAEVAHAEGLRRWWGLLDGKTLDKLAKATDKMVQNPKAEGK
jgi:hypothetical protein